MSILSLASTLFAPRKSATVSDRFYTIPNMVTLGRIFGSFIYVYQYTFNWETDWILPVVLLILLSDWLDGWLAKVLDQHSHWGKALDPIADRVFLLATLGNLFVLSDWRTAIILLFILAIEAYVFAGAYLAYKLHNVITPVHWLGKLRMAVHCLVAFGIVFQAYVLGHYFISPFFLALAALAASFAAAQVYIEKHVLAPQ